MSGSTREILENSSIDYLFFDQRSSFELLNENFALFAYIFYFFFMTQKNTKPFEAKIDKEVIETLKINKTKFLKNKEIKKLHITHDNYWSYKKNKLVERTIEDFNLSYSNRHFYGAKKICNSGFDLSSKIKFKIIAIFNISNLKAILLLLSWIIGFLKNSIPLNRQLAEANLPLFPLGRFVVYLFRFKIYEIMAKQWLSENVYEEVYFSNYYSLNSMAICSAAKSLRISTINLQHGIQGSLHPAFNFRAFKTIKLPKYVPAIFNCYYLGNRHNLSHPDISVIQKKRIKKSIQKKRLKKILVTLQPSFYFDQEIKNVFLRLAKLGVEIKFKPHPRVNPQYDEIKNLCKFNNIEILPNNIHISEALKDIDAHITGFSSSGLDAVKAQVKTYFLDKRANEIFGSILDTNIAEVCISTRDLIKKLVKDD